MITKGIIVSRPVESNKYSVRIPSFEEAGGSQFIAEATLSYTSGIVNSLNEGDVVFVAFEDHYKDKPTIIGKLFLTDDSSHEVGYANVQSLNVSDSATLPSNTKLGDVTAEQLSSLYMAVTSGGSVEPTPVVSDLMLEITYSQLVATRNAGKLIPGMQYRITDYEFTTTASNTSSANHPFDVIVIADDESTLNESARAIQHENDTYFASNDLQAWSLRYCLDNDTSRFSWADSENGKGVIYRMIDEFENDCPYDFKNCLFSSQNYTSAYTFSRTKNGAYEDASIYGYDAANCFNNVIRKALTFRSGSYVEPQNLNFNVFVSHSSTFSCHDNFFDYDCMNNRFEYSCQNNTFGRHCSNNACGHNSSCNTFMDDCSFNTAGSHFFSNVVGKRCINNWFGTYVQYSNFGTLCQGISVAGCVNYMSLANNCSYLNIVGATQPSTSGDTINHVTIVSGVCGTDSTNKKTITLQRNAQPTIVQSSSTQIMQI